MQSTGRNFLVYLEGTLYLLEKRRDRMPTQAWEENYCLFIGVRLLPLLRSRCKNPTPLLALQSKYVYIQDISPHSLHWVKHMGGGHYQNARPDSAIVSSQAPCFGNATTLRPYPRQHVIQGSGRLSCSLLTFLKWSTKPCMENTEASSTRTFTFPNTWIIQGPNALKTKRILKWQRLNISHLHQALRLSGTPLVAQILRFFMSFEVSSRPWTEASSGLTIAASTPECCSLANADQLLDASTRYKERDFWEKGVQGLRYLLQIAMTPALLQITRTTTSTVGFNALVSWVQWF